MNNPPRHRYQVLDSLRGICACMVVLYHFHTVGWISNLPLVRNSWLFVDFFFVLSGFVITTAYRAKIADQTSSIGVFMWLRMGRIYPVHLVVTALFVLARLALFVTIGSKAFQGSTSAETLLASLTLTQTFFIPNFAVWNIPSWSIAVEIWTYLVFATFFRALRSQTMLVIACVIVAAVSCAYIVAVQGRYFGGQRFAPFFRCTYGFAIGVIGAQLLPSMRPRGPSAGTALELVAVLLVAVLVSVADHAALAIAAPLVFLAVILVFAEESGLVSSCLITKYPLMIGELSYSIYMIHYFIMYRISGVIQIGHRGAAKAYIVCGDVNSCSATGSPMLADALIIPVLLAVIGAAYLLRNFIEMPGNLWARNAQSRWWANSRGAPSDAIGG